MHWLVEWLVRRQSPDTSAVTMLRSCMQGEYYILFIVHTASFSRTWNNGSLCFVSGSCSCTSNSIVYGSLKVNRRSQVYTEGMRFIVLTSPHYINFVYLIAAILCIGRSKEGTPGVRTLSAQFLSFSCSFWRPPQRNPGFATTLIKLFPVSSGLCRTTLLYGLRGEVYGRFLAWFFWKVEGSCAHTFKLMYSYRMATIHIMLTYIACN